MDILLSSPNKKRINARYIDPVSLYDVLLKNCPGSSVIFDDINTFDSIRESFNRSYLHIFSDHSTGLKTLDNHKIDISTVIVLDAHLDIGHSALDKDMILGYTYANWISNQKKINPSRHFFLVGSSAGQDMDYYSVELISWTDTFTDYIKNKDNPEYVSDSIAFLPLDPVSYSYSWLRSRFSDRFPGTDFDDFLDTRDGWYVKDDRVVFKDSISSASGSPDRYVSDFIRAVGEPEKTVLSLDIDVLSSQGIGKMPIDQAISIVSACKDSGVIKYDLALEHKNLKKRKYLPWLFGSDKVFRKELYSIISEIVS